VFEDFFLSLCLSVFLSLCLSVSLSLCLSVSLSLSLHRSQFWRKGEEKMLAKDIWPFEGKLKEKCFVKEFPVKSGLTPFWIDHEEFETICSKIFFWKYSFKMIIVIVLRYYYLLFKKSSFDSFLQFMLSERFPYLKLNTFYYF
jgi:hypothetical protein